MKTRRESAGQLSFDLSGSATDARTAAEPLADFIADITRVWGFPIHQNLRVVLRDHDVDEARGRLELVAIPDLPPRTKTPLQLRIGDIAFLSSQVVSWSDVEALPTHPRHG